MSFLAHISLFYSTFYGFAVLYCFFLAWLTRSEKVEHWKTFSILFLSAMLFGGQVFDLWNSPQNMAIYDMIICAFAFTVPGRLAYRLIQITLIMIYCSIFSFAVAYPYSGSIWAGPEFYFFGLLTGKFIWQSVLNLLFFWQCIEVINACYNSHQDHISRRKEERDDHGTIVAREGDAAYANKTANPA